MNSRRRSSGPLLVGLAVCVAGIGIAWLWSRANARVAVPMPREVSASSAGPSVRLVEAVGGEDIAAAAERKPWRSAVPAAELRGHVLDHAGGPIADFPLQLTRTDRFPLMRVTTEADGAFAFADLPPGAFVIRTWIHSLDVTLELAAGEQREVELRLRPDEVLLLGSVTSHGRPLVGCHVLFDAGDPMRTDKAGRFFRIGPACELGLRLLSSHSAVGERDHLELASVTLPLQSAPARYLWSIDIPTSRVELALMPAGLPAMAKLQFELRGLLGDDPEPRQLVFAAANGRSVVCEDLPPGRWSVRPRAPTLGDVTPIEFDNRDGPAEMSMSFDVSPMGHVRLVARDARGRELLIPADLMPPLCDGARELAATLGGDASGSVRDAGLGYYGVPAGVYQLVCEDEEAADGALRFLPFDPLPPRQVHVEVLCEAIVELQVEPRALVELRATEGFGREEPFASIAVFAGERAVQVWQAPRPSRWRGYLPPGAYRAVVTGKAGERTETFTVGREPLRREFRR